ncbi:hypothetical protein B0H34DRAFT_795694 [Crassisporium funariophilum]|nr:hypothetical protein B0H34DRAFT_795694 [Crassisporium funariophilum]
MSYSSHNDNRQSSRPTLPPIRDLFRDELSRRPTPSHESAQLALARLRVSDDLDSRMPHHQHYGVSQRNPAHPVHRSMVEPSDLSMDSHGTNSYRVARQDTRSSREHMTATSHTYSSANRPTTHANPRSQASNPHLSSPPPMRTESCPLMQGRQPQLSHRSAIASPNYYGSPHYPPHPHGTHYPSMPISRSGTTSPDHMHRPWNISTIVNPSSTEDDERTPVARRYNSMSASVSMNTPPVNQEFQDDSSNSSAKYECRYCGKGFNRPSSLKIHLNSHTGEKPFVCPVDSCGRSFSVLSNMRRHARVHTSVPINEPTHEDSLVSGSTVSTASSSESNPSKWKYRRDSVASSSSSMSRSRSVSSNDDLDDESQRPEKRTRS